MWNTKSWYIESITYERYVTPTCNLLHSLGHFYATLVVHLASLSSSLWKTTSARPQNLTAKRWAVHLDAMTSELPHVGFLDLNEAIARRYDALGEAAVEPLFGEPHTHTSRAGAELNADVVVSCLKALKNDPVAGDFSAKGAGVAAYKE